MSLFSFSLIVIFSLFISINAQAYMNTENCNSIVCQMPDCRCPTLDIPGNLPLNSTPQFIFFSFDDSMYLDDFRRMSNYYWVFNNTNITDSLGCTIKPSWYSLEICNILYLYKKSSILI